MGVAVADDLEPHQRLVEPSWQSRVSAQLPAQDGETISLRSLDGSTRTERRLAMKAARKQKHGGKR